jgi:hypothetical protein
MNTNFDEFLERAKRKHGSIFSDRELSKKFIPFYRTGQRIRIRTFGEIVTGTVSATTGWIPVFILMRTSRSIGSMYTLKDTDEILEIQNARGKYEAA